eukprot:CAMPEP_0178999248 /NCGR_PEP_ID=MMETSP0795-20121207/9946_1 /TAXON_ID=88552 /ORGANISM="Amoebophrya sp., Strain Ameob2" /LENGTH=847 /DNA_ID=CAMNT_0020691983 /DNA_START=515 /DNA_END=3058 /DNA_ORIENTATION=-
MSNYPPGPDGQHPAMGQQQHPATMGPQLSDFVMSGLDTSAVDSGRNSVNMNNGNSGANSASGMLSPPVVQLLASAVAAAQQQQQQINHNNSGYVVDTSNPASPLQMPLQGPPMGTSTLNNGVDPTNLAQRLNYLSPMNSPQQAQLQFEQQMSPLHGAVQHLNQQMQQQNCNHLSQHMQLNGSGGEMMSPRQGVTVNPMSPRQMLSPPPPGAQTPGQLAILQELVKAQSGGAMTGQQGQQGPHQNVNHVNGAAAGGGALSPQNAANLQNQMQLSGHQQGLNVVAAQQVQQLLAAQQGANNNTRMLSPLQAGAMSGGSSNPANLIGTNNLSGMGAMSPLEVPSPGAMSPVNGASANQIPFGVINIPRGMDQPIPPGGHIAALAAQKIGAQIGQGGVAGVSGAGRMDGPGQSVLSSPQHQPHQHQNSHLAQNSNPNSIQTAGLLHTSGGYHVPLVHDSNSSDNPTLLQDSVESLPERPVRLVSVNEYRDFLRQAAELKKRNPKKFLRVHLPDLEGAHVDKKVNLIHLKDETENYGDLHLSGGMKRTTSLLEGQQENNGGSSHLKNGGAAGGNGNGNHVVDAGGTLNGANAASSSLISGQPSKQLSGGSSSKQGSSSPESIIGTASSTYQPFSINPPPAPAGGRNNSYDGGHHHYGSGEHGSQKGGKKGDREKGYKPSARGGGDQGSYGGGKGADRADMVLPDSRTTMMLRNIPNKYTQPMLLSTLSDQGFEAKFDFFYLPIDFRNRCNVGYAFINFVTPEDAKRFLQVFHKFKLKAYNSPKVCEVNYARVQGLQANIEVYRNSPVNGIPIKQYRPLIFRGGNEVEFPSPDAPLPPIQLRSEEEPRSGGGA